MAVLVAGRHVCGPLGLPVAGGSIANDSSARDHAAVVVGRFSGRYRGHIRKRVHVGSRRVRDGAAVAQIVCRDGDIHVDDRSDRLRHPSYDRSLNHAAHSDFSHRYSVWHRHFIVRYGEPGKGHQFL